MSDGELPVVTEWDAPGTLPPVHGVVLAAGMSSGFGPRNKLLAPVDARPLVRHAVKTVRKSSVDGLTVIVGHEESAVRSALDGLELNVVYYDDYRSGQASSVRAIVRAARAAGANAILLALGDMPDVLRASVDALIEASTAGLGTALAAAYRRRRGNPVLFGTRYYDELTGIEGDTGGGGSVLLSASDASLVETRDPGVRRDIDTAGDYTGSG